MWMFIQENGVVSLDKSTKNSKSTFLNSTLGAIGHGLLNDDWEGKDDERLWQLEWPLLQMQWHCACYATEASTMQWTPGLCF